jgi:hypothetical protein
MPGDHAGTGVSHHFPDLFPHGWLVTVDLAIGAGCLIFLKGALVKALCSIIQKLFAFTTDFVSGSVVIVAIHVYHSFNGMLFPYHSGVFLGHKQYVVSCFPEMFKALK